MAHGLWPWTTMAVCSGVCIHHQRCFTFATDPLLFAAMTHSLAALVPPHRLWWFGPSVLPLSNALSPQLLLSFIFPVLPGRKINVWL